MTPKNTLQIYLSTRYLRRSIKSCKLLRILAILRQASYAAHLTELIRYSQPLGGGRKKILPPYKTLSNIS
jgi:hypothetical protein